MVLELFDLILELTELAIELFVVHLLGRCVILDGDVLSEVELKRCELSFGLFEAHYNYISDTRHYV
jgi:hypothetical protein